LYTLHGHYGPITCLFIDQVNPHMAASGSQDGMLCVWDLITGLSLLISVIFNTSIWQVSHNNLNNLFRVTTEIIK